MQSDQVNIEIKGKGKAPPRKKPGDGVLLERERERHQRFLEGSGDLKQLSALLSGRETAGKMFLIGGVSTR